MYNHKVKHLQVKKSKLLQVKKFKNRPSHFQFLKPTIPEEYIVKSTLRSPTFRDVIEEIVQKRSNIQTTSNLVFTQAILLACKDGPLSENMVSQAFIGACMKAVCTRGTQRPSIGKYTHAECLPFLQAAQAEVVAQMDTFESDEHLTETMNQAAKEYHTVLHNNVWIHFSAWQKKLVMTELYQTDLPKSTYNFVCKKILQIINRSKLGPEAARYKCPSVRTKGEPFLQSKVAKAIIDRLQLYMQYIPDIVTTEPKKPKKPKQSTEPIEPTEPADPAELTDPAEPTKDVEPTRDWYGVITEGHIQKHISLFLQAGIFMVERLVEIRSSVVEG